jgi:aspartate racemase
MKYALLYGFVILSIFLALFIGGPNADNVASSKEAINATLTKNAGAVSSNESQMKTIGIIGGVSWVSSIEYYRLMNEMVNKQLGGLHSAKILMYSIEFGNFSDEERLAEKGDWSLLNRTMIDAAQRLKRGGADFIVIASNTLNSRADDIQEKVHIPVLHIADATGEKVNKSGIKTVALLGTKYTMEQNFYRDRLEKKYGLIVITPNETPMRPGRGSHVTDGKPHIVIRSR